MNNLSWSSVVLGAGPFLLVLVLKFLIDFRLASLAVKYLFWLPVRNYFRAKPVNVSGTWDFVWSSGGSDGFSKESDRHGHPKIRQLDAYVYAEFYSQQRLYALFGEIKHGYVVGDWYDIRDPLGYFGVLQLEIVNSSELRGTWLGHSKSQRTIRHDEAVLRRIDG
ncbi:MAG: hypothetical protein CFE43_18865 [Burkholderiales bacterium PBB3]|nr:MAG: hypothetical protein CFE43_18865 [Burkholderiales bacterium PBB3]